MKKVSRLSIFIFAFLIISVVYPIVSMLFKVEWGSFGNLISSNAFREALSNSVNVTVISTVLSVSIAYFLAYSLNRANIKHKFLLKTLLTLPMLIPSISHGLGLINLFGANGSISKIFGFNIVGKSGIIIGSIMYSFPVAFLMLNDGFHYIDNKMYDVAKVLGFNKLQSFKMITFCYLKKPIFSSIFAVFTLIFTDYGVPLSVGGKFITLPVFLYKEVIGLLDFSKGTMIGLFLLIPAFVSFIFDNFTKDYNSDNYVKNYYKISDNKLRDIFSIVFVYIVLILIFLVFGSFIYYAFVDNVIVNKEFSLKHFSYVFNDGIGKYIFNSLFIAIIVSIIGTFVSYFTAYVTCRVKSGSSRLIHLLTIMSLAIPGIVLGLAYTISFNNSFIYNTFFILIFVNIVHFMASPYLMAYNALKKVNSNYEIIAKTCNIPIYRIVLDVIIPCTKGTIVDMFAYFFVNSMTTISAVTFLFNTNTMPLSLMINQYEGNLMLGEAAIVSLFMLLFNLIVKCVVCFINRRDVRRIVGDEINV